MNIDEQKCPHCRGTGRDPMSDIINWFPCTACNGTGNRTPTPVEFKELVRERCKDLL